MEQQTFRDRLGDLFIYGASAAIDSNFGGRAGVNDPVIRTQTQDGRSVPAGVPAGSGAGAIVASVPAWVWLGAAVLAVVLIARRA